MKALVLSDLHSNIHALEAIWKQEHDSDLVLCAGDLVDYGPFPCQVLAWLRERKAICVQGNHDAWVASNYRQGHSLYTIPESERSWAHYNAGMLGEDEIGYLEGLPCAIDLEMDGLVYGITHMYREYEEIVSLHAYERFSADSFSRPGAAPLTRLIFGHTHRRSIRYLSDERLWLNPGSISYRRRDDPDQAAHYATITGGIISLKRLEYDLTPLRSFIGSLHLSESEMEQAGFYFGER
jgi:predicted phosphodiesterase